MLALTGKLLQKDRITRQGPEGWARRIETMGTGLVGRTLGLHLFNLLGVVGAAVAMTAARAGGVLLRSEGLLLAGALAAYAEVAAGTEAAFAGVVQVRHGVDGLAAPAGRVGTKPLGAGTRRDVGSRRRAGRPTEPVEPRADLGYSANFLWMSFGEEAAPEPLVPTHAAILAAMVEQGSRTIDLSDRAGAGRSPPPGRVLPVLGRSRRAPRRR